MVYVLFLYVSDEDGTDNLFVLAVFDDELKVLKACEEARISPEYTAFRKSHDYCMLHIFDYELNKLDLNVFTKEENNGWKT